MNTITEVISVLLADDHPVTRAGIRAILEKAPDIQVVGEAQDGTEAQELVVQLYPRILLLDLQMPGPRPVEIEKWVRANCPETITLVLTAHDRDAYLADMIETAAGFIIKGTPAENLVAAIRRAARGEILFNGEQRSRARRWREQVGKKWDSLTERERQILIQVAKGKTDKEIAQELQIKVKTVSNHICNILNKLNIASRIEAALWAVREGFAD